MSKASARTLEVNVLFARILYAKKDSPLMRTAPTSCEGASGSVKRFYWED